MENGLEAVIGTGAKVQGTPAGGFQAVVAHGFAQADDPQGGAKTLFRMGPVGHDFLDDFGAIRADGFDPFQDAAGSPFQMLLMGLGPVFLQGREAAWPWAAQVGRHAFAVLKQLDGGVGQSHVKLMMDELMAISRMDN